MTSSESALAWERHPGLRGGTLRLLRHRYVASPPTSMLGALYANIERHRKERSRATMPAPRPDKMVADLSNKMDQHKVGRSKKCAAAHRTCYLPECGVRR